MFLNSRLTMVDTPPVRTGIRRTMVNTPPVCTVFDHINHGHLLSQSEPDLQLELDPERLLTIQMREARLTIEN
jgi:hypothetical protein